MTEITIHGRGGQGGVTLAKLIATAYFLKGQHAQAFGVYAAERSGAPLQAFVRIDREEITNHNQVRTPDHLIVLDGTLIGPNILAGHQSNGWIILNAAAAPAQFAGSFAGRNVATVDATAIALSCELGTRTVPIVNTTLLGAVGRVLRLNWAEVEAAIRQMKFNDANVSAAKRAFEEVRCASLPGEAQTDAAVMPADPPLGLLDAGVGAPPKLRTGSWATQRPHRRTLRAPCAHACPAGNDIPGFIFALGNKNTDEALRILLETTPLPGVCGRVCPAPCIDACNRNEFDQPVHVRELERYAAEHGRWPDVETEVGDTRVAIVGSGPAGLSCAYHLGRLGHRVTIYEGGDELGGLLRTGIPEYRLPREVLDQEIDFILRHHVSVQCGQYISRENLLALSYKYDAVFVAAGLQEMRGLALGEVDGDAVVQGIDFLDRARRHEVGCTGERVIVIGGGNTAVDAARSALRLGAKHVSIIYRRTRDEMPAIDEEIDEALAEHVRLYELAAPLYLRRDQNGCTLTCQRMKLGEPDESRRRRPVPVDTEDAMFDLRCDRIILALGQFADMSILPEGAEITEAESLLGLSGAPIFIGGDLATNDGTVAHAIGNARRVAWHIHQTLTGENLFPDIGERVATREFIHAHLFDHAPAEAPVEEPAAHRRRSFVEVRHGYPDEPDYDRARHEAMRCFSCGMCTECDRCVEHCPEGILLHKGDGRYDFNYDYCKGCGVCASQCPRGVIYMTNL